MTYNISILNDDVISNSQRVEILEITPNMAKIFLEANSGNFRKPDQKRVDRYARDMRSGKWDLTGDTIKISDRVLIDGQHRLLAVVKSGATIKSVVAFNMDSSGLNIDRNKPRTNSQWLRHHGIKNSTVVATAAKLVLQHDLGKWSKKILQQDYYTDADIVDYSIKYATELNQAIQLARPSAPLVSHGMAAAIVHISAGRGNPNDFELIKWFWTGFASGIGLEENAPPLVLRNKIIASRVRTSSAPLSRDYVRHMTTIAWNKTVENKQINPGHLRLILVGPRTNEPPNTIKPASEAGDYML